MKHTAMTTLVASALLTMSGCTSESSTDSEVVHKPLELQHNEEYTFTIQPEESIFILWNERNCNKASHKKIDESIQSYWYDGWVQIYQVPNRPFYRGPFIDAVIEVHNPTDAVVETTWISLTPGTHYEEANFTCSRS